MIQHLLVNLSGCVIRNMMRDADTKQSREHPIEDPQGLAVSGSQGDEVGQEVWPDVAAGASLGGEALNKRTLGRRVRVWFPH